MSDKIAILEAKIAENKQGLAGTLLARSMLKDRNGIARAEIQITEYERSLAYFTQELAKLQARKVPEIASTRANSIKRHYTNLELLTSETPYNKPKVSLKLHEIDYKTDVERKLLSGIKKLAEAINGPSNKVARRRQIEVNAEKEQSEQKLELLSRALRKYKQLHIEDDEEELGFDSVLSTELPPGIRQPVTGTLHLQIMQARNLEHVPTRTMRSPITITTAKIDGTVKYKSHPTRTDKWFENCKIPVNKGSELELEIHDESSDKRQLIGIIWIKVADIAEALRKQKVKDGQNDLGWVSAKIVRQQQNESIPTHHLTDSNVSMTSTTTDSPSSASSTASSSIAALGGGGGSSPSSSSFIPAVPPNSTATSRTGSSTTTTDILYHRTSISKSDENGIMEWFDVEPYGELALKLNFVRENPTVTFPFAPKQKPILVRAGAVREKPAGERYEVNGHQFIEHRLYNIMKCAYCDDFLVKNGFRCDGNIVLILVMEDVLEKWLQNDLEEDRVNHRIPHRFIPITNIGANWCCHCGQVLSLGSRKARKCSVPDFCGLSMEIANQMLAEIRAARDRPIPPLHRQSIQQPIHSTSNTKTTQTPALILRKDTIIGDNESFDSMSVQASEGGSIRPYSLSGPSQPITTTTTTTTITECNNEETESNYNTNEIVSKLGILPIGGRREQKEQDDNTTVLGDNNNSRLEDPYLRIYEQLDHQLQGHYTETLINDSHMYSQVCI
ncbi:hypothetical protein INT45_007885 [Circinella minor]|uniref:C2 domain-containing protein n=1 Tax=Circinella minor TaxID=1195481 RepID=A0A8H7S9N4_9FUNG|nr:hypothetical protein INT45_007885 [Circinella minor]